MAYHIDVNTIRVRTVILDVFPDIYKHMIDNWFPPATVERMIKTDNDKFLKQISPAERKIIQSLKCSQYMKVDGALMYKIIRYFKLIQEPTRGWGKEPEAYHINQGDDAERMRKLRNDYVHDNSSTVSDEKFHDFFNKSIEIAGRLDLAVGRLVNGVKEQVINLKTSVIGDSIVKRENNCSAEKKFFTIDSESGGKPTGVTLYYGNDISDQFKCHENEEIGTDEYTLRLLIDGKAECQKIVDYVKKYPEACSSPAIQIKYAEQGSIILHISIDRKSFTSCEILHNAIQLFIKTIFHHEEIQRTNMLDFDMVLAIADYTEQGSHDRGTICSDNSYLAEEMSDPWNNQGVKLYLTIPKKTFAERTDFYLHMDSVIRTVMSATTIDISIDKPIHAIFTKCDRKEVTKFLPNSESEEQERYSRLSMAAETQIKYENAMKEIENIKCSGAKVSSKLPIRRMSAPSASSVLMKTEKKVPTVVYVGMGTTLPQNRPMAAPNAIPVSGYNQKSQTEGKTITGEEFAQAQTPVNHNLPVFVTLRQQLNVKLSRNEYMNLGSCMKVDNTLVFADYFNKKLIIRKTDVAEVFYIPLPYRPCYITDIDSNTVAVTCTLDRFILIINLSTGEVTSTIETSDCLWGISYYDNNLYVVIGRSEKQMHVMDLMGNVLRILALGTIRGITVHRDRLVCIELTTINCFTLDGKLLWRFENEKYRNLNRVITDNDGNVYVTDENTNTVVVVYDDGRHYGDILTGSDELCQPAGIHFDKKQNILIVCNRQDGKAFLFDVKKK